MCEYLNLKLWDSLHSKSVSQFNLDPYVELFLHSSKPFPEVPENPFLSINDR